MHTFNTYNIKIKHVQLPYFTEYTEYTYLIVNYIHPLVVLHSRSYTHALGHYVPCSLVYCLLSTSTVYIYCVCCLLCLLSTSTVSAVYIYYVYCLSTRLACLLQLSGLRHLNTRASRGAGCQEIKIKLMLKSESHAHHWQTRLHTLQYNIYIILLLLQGKPFSSYRGRGLQLVLVCWGHVSLVTMDTYCLLYISFNAISELLRLLKIFTTF